jgi:hypothetical protein
MGRFSLLQGKLHVKHQSTSSTSDSVMSSKAKATSTKNESAVGEASTFVVGETMVARVKSVVDTAFVFASRLPPSVEIAPFGEVKTEFAAFFLVFGTLGWLYKRMWRSRFRRSDLSNRMSGGKSRRASATHQTAKKGSTSSKFDKVGTGYKEEVYEFMDTCAAVKGQLRHVEDPDRARTLKLQLLTKEAPEALGAPTSACSFAPEHEDTSHSSMSNHNELVELCLDVRKGLHKVQDPDEARKLKLQRLREQEISKSATEVAKQHQQAGFSKRWMPSR